MDQRNTIVSYKSSPDCKALWITKRKALYKCILLLLIFTHNITFPVRRKGSTRPPIYESESIAFIYIL